MHGIGQQAPRYFVGPVPYVCLGVPDSHLGVFPQCLLDLLQKLLAGLINGHSGDLGQAVKSQSVDLGDLVTEGARLFFLGRKILLQVVGGLRLSVEDFIPLGDTFLGVSNLLAAFFQFRQGLPDQILGLGARFFEAGVPQPFGFVERPSRAVFRHLYSTPAALSCYDGADDCAEDYSRDRQDQLNHWAS
ncbi:MAG: hypothetical protein AAB092_00420 [Chloroflexota bacterium]